MIIVDNALRAREAQGKPVRVGMIGAGFMAQGLANQIIHSVPGMEMTAVYGRHVERAQQVYNYSGRDDVVVPSTVAELEDAVRAGRPVVTDDAFLLCEAEQIDVLVDVTGSVEFGAQVALEAFKHGKSVVLMNAELDATIGPILQTYADKHDVALSSTEGDEPGLQMNLYRWVRGLGLVPRVIGNVKGLQDPYRNPTTQQEFAEKWGQNPAMVTSFADGSKISFEQAIVANATGFKVQARGMSRGVEYNGSIMEIASLYDVDAVRELGGIVDYTVGPSDVKIFCLAEHSDPKQRRYLELYKLGEGPLYPFWIPYHLPHFETPNAIARVALLDDNVAPPLAGEVRRPGGRSLRCRQARSKGRRGAGRVRHVHDLRRGHERGRDERRAIPTRGACRGLPTPEGREQRSGADVRGRRPSSRASRRPAPRGTVPPLPWRNLARRAPYDESVTRRRSWSSRSPAESSRLSWPRRM